MSTTTITFEDRPVACQTGESVLDALLREHIDIPHGCKQGACQSCMMKSLDGAPPPEAQNGLKDVLRHQNHFLACLCYPQRDMRVGRHTSQQFNRATVIGKQPLNSETLLLTLHCHGVMDFHAGQFVHLKRADGLSRSYSIANSRRHAHRLSFHIRRLPGGRFSEWAHGELNVGDDIEVSDPQGLCYYLPDDKERNMLLIGTGSGLAPLAGIIEEALHQGHSSEIHLYHGSREVDGLYWVDEMRELAQRHAHFHYTPCISRGNAPQGIAQGRANDVALAAIPQLKDWRLYLCGHPDMVNQSKRQAFMQGARLQDIHSDAFHVASSTQE
ncbi:MAG: 2Fe-2S iron-sulfur cluster binding domain-containing protein [Methylomonas sp.]|nr:2Fe-2S iron-sulfur cluster binding domain-containing protein [Methylomonas sp.]PPD20882.1 MAG: oxygenase [Methylomonas sp.]PPD26330.1 MAG: oxygenase [Methylomonas sp.]PPD38051.1 MAG: oxygenase [Methylomonas sp.]PPD40314.1 MAG: oxygenase [Methylomonas sp.]